MIAAVATEAHVGSSTTPPMTSGTATIATDTRPCTTERSSLISVLSDVRNSSSISVRPFSPAADVGGQEFVVYVCAGPIAAEGVVDGVDAVGPLLLVVWHRTPLHDVPRVHVVQLPAHHLAHAGHQGRVLGVPPRVVLRAPPASGAEARREPRDDGCDDRARQPPRHCLPVQAGASLMKKAPEGPAIRPCARRAISAPAPSLLGMPLVSMHYHLKDCGR